MGRFKRSSNIRNDDGGSILASIIFMYYSLIMKIELTEKEINLQQAKDGTFFFRINENVLVENLPNKEEALKTR